MYPLQKCRLLLAENSKKTCFQSHFLPLTPSKSFGISDVQGVLGSEKHVMNFCVFKYVNWNGFKANR